MITSFFISLISLFVKKTINGECVTIYMVSKVVDFDRGGEWLSFGPDLTTNRQEMVEIYRKHVFPFAFFFFSKNRLASRRIWLPTF
jgi:hypothetical protein